MTQTRPDSGTTQQGPEST